MATDLSTLRLPKGSGIVLDRSHNGFRQWKIALANEREVSVVAFEHTEMVEVMTLGDWRPFPKHDWPIECPTLDGASRVLACLARCE